MPDTVPLSGLRILVTRAEEQAGALAERLRALGAEPVVCSTISHAPPLDWSPLDRALADLRRYNWLIFSSANGVRFFFERAATLGVALDGLSSIKVAAVGRSTAQALAKYSVQVDFVPERYDAEALVVGMMDVSGLHMLFPRADIARPTIVDGLTAQGALVDDVIAYRTLPAAPDERGTLHNIDIATFTSASTVRNLATWLGAQTLTEALAGARIACIGPITAQTATEYGLSVDILATEHTLDGLIRAITTSLEAHHT